MNRPRPKNLLTAASALTVLLAVASSALAQGGWNRQLEGLSLTETPGGLVEVTAVWSILLTEAQSAPIDLGTGVDLRVNGVVVATVPHTIGIDPSAASCADGSSCGGSCGSATIDGQSASLICRPDGPCNPICDCACGTPPFTSPFDPVPVSPGDEIMVLLRPAPGALPDPDTSDDQIVVTHDGNPIFWDREVTSIDIQPATAGPGYDITAEGTIFHEGVIRFLGTGVPAPLDTQVELRVNGVPVATADLPFQPVPFGSTCECGVQCGTSGGFPMYCAFPAPIEGCACGYPWITNFPDVGSLEPGDEIMVILRPAPGALPELPGFPQDEHSRPFGATDVPLVAASASGELLGNRPNPFREETAIGFTTKRPARVRLEVFGVGGRRVRTLIDRSYETAGNWSASWDGITDRGERAPGGIYFSRLTVGRETHTRKMTLAR